MVGFTQQGADRRRGTRIQQRGLAVIQIAGRRLGGFVANLSGGGAFINCSQELAIGTPCEIRLWMNEGSKLSSLSLQGDICRRTPQGVGIRFVGPQETQDWVASLIDSQQASSAA